MPETASASTPTSNRGRLPGPRVAAAAMAVSLLVGLAAPAFAQSDAATGDNLVDLRLKWLRQVARQDEAKWESDLISAPRSGAVTMGSIGDPNAILKELGPVLTDDYEKIRNGLIALAEKAKANREGVQKDWADVCRQRAAFRQYTDGQQTVYGFNFDANQSPGLRPDLFDVILLGWGAVVLIVALTLRARERRLLRRKAARGAVLASLLLALALPGCDFGRSEAPAPWAEREQADLSAAIKDATEKADAATAAANKKWQDAVDGWAKMLTAPKEKEAVDAIVQREEVGESGSGGLRDRLRGVAIEAQLAALLVKDTDDVRNELAEERVRLDDLVASAKWRSIAFTVGRVSIAVLLFGFAVAPFWTARRARRKAVRLASRTCPRCFRRDTLKVEKRGAVADSRPVYRGGRAKTKPKPDAEPEDADEDVEALCTKCGLRMRRSYLTVPRLCFPTVGIRASGKTHMLVTAYDRIRKRTAPTAAVVQPAPSGGDIDKRFDRLIDEILHRRGEAGATDLALPDPILVHLKDCDPAGPSPALINLFDYSGEMINPDVDVHQLKSTAVRMDGFMLFLDPTQLYGDEANLTLDEQLSMLDQFLAHMRKERKVPIGNSIPVPVAVCITKFDLLPTDNPIGGQSVPFIRHLLSELNPSPRAMTLETIQARSDLVEEMLPLMFTGADIRGIVEGYFGKQVMFFPISSVGLFEHELGIKDLSRRTIAPFGVAEPLIWLLHMHGYEVFG